MSCNTQSRDLKAHELAQAIYKAYSLFDISSCSVHVFDFGYDRLRINSQQSNADTSHRTPTCLRGTGPVSYTASRATDIIQRTKAIIPFGGNATVTRKAPNLSWLLASALARFTSQASDPSCCRSATMQQIIAAGSLGSLRFRVIPQTAKRQHGQQSSPSGKNSACGIRGGGLYRATNVPFRSF